MYLQLPPFEALTQGEIIDDCPILSWEREGGGWNAKDSAERVIILTQACDLEQAKTSRVQVAIVHEAQKLAAAGLLKAKAISDQVRKHKVFGWYFLPVGQGVTESIVDLRDIHTLPRDLLLELAGAGKRVAALSTPYREHLSQHFAVTFSRIGLPEPYETE